MILYDRPRTPQRLAQQRRRYVYQNRHHKILLTTTTCSCTRRFTVQDPNCNVTIALSLPLHHFHFITAMLRLVRIMSRYSQMAKPLLLLLLWLLLPLHIHHRLHHHYIHGIQAFHPHHCGISSMKRYHSRPRPRHAVSFASVSIFESTDTTVTTIRTTTTIAPPTTTVSHHHHNHRDNNHMIMIIDVENVRGFNGFRYTHSQLLQLLQVYLVGQPVPPSLLLVMDHGNLPSSYYVPPPQHEPHSNGYAIVFAGPHCKADDTIVHDVIPYLWTTLSPLLLSSLHNDHPEDKPPHPRIKVVTADRMLISRCHRAVREFYKSRNTLPPSSTTGARSNHKKKKYEMEVSDPHHPNIRLEIVNPNVLWTELIRLPAPWNEVETNVTDNEKVNNTWTPNHVSARRWKHRTSRIYVKKETTEDRIILAERLRLELEEQQQQQQDDSIHQNMIGSNEGTTTTSIPAAYAYVIHKQRNHQRSATAQSRGTVSATAVVPWSANHTEEAESVLTDVPPTVESQPERLRLVVVSDTHGFEDQLIGPLPDGDVLLHLGDFAVDTVVTNTAGGHKNRRNRHDHSQLKNFDVWLAQQSARTKIVVRGNHDPRSMAFVKSGAVYVTQPTIMDIGGYKFAFVPYQSATKNGLRHKGTIPKTGCDVIVSHVPPYSILDRCHTGKLAGSNTLLKGAQSINGKDGPPILWLCGHIHESRGIVHDIVLCKSKSKDAATTTKITTDIGTTIVNAACANLGRANYIEYGPTVLDLCRNIEFPNTKLDGRDDDISDSSISSNNNKLNKQVNLVHMDGRYEFMNSKYPYFFRCEGSNDVAATGSSSICNMLLAIDLGLRTGVSLFDRANSGRLVRYDHFDYDTAAALEVGAVQLLQDWEMEMNTFLGNSLINSNKIVRRITHIAIEGSDPPLIEAWKRALLQNSSNNKFENIKRSKNAGTTVDSDDRSTAIVLPPVRKLLLVSPNEWRTDLLTRTERSSGESAKLASRRMAQCIIQEHGTKNNAHHRNAQNNNDAVRSTVSLSCLEPPPALDLTANSSTNSADHILSTDVAESILMGYHITRRLGWCTL